MRCHLAYVCVTKLVKALAEPESVSSERPDVEGCAAFISFWDQDRHWVDSEGLAVLSTSTMICLAA